MSEGEEASIAGSDTPFTDEQEEAEFIAVNGGPSGRLHTPEEAAEEKALTLESIRDWVTAALQNFQQTTGQPHTVSRLLGSLTPNASRSERLPFTPAANLHLSTRSRDYHVLHLAGLSIQTWGILIRDEMGWAVDLDGLRALIVRLEDVIYRSNQFKVYPVDPRSSLFVLRRITDQAVLDKASEDEESERANRLSDIPRRTD
ncbi:hypothetical protein LCGC14_1415660 [marine sediment metagenome]|uniref:Uncharacterized protein n=1 Tax=marine sediment metagenome TaxID=412755 RepID=A0A0F9MUN2_9ZZZZ